MGMLEAVGRGDAAERLYCAARLPALQRAWEGYAAGTPFAAWLPGFYDQVGRGRSASSPFQVLTGGASAWLRWRLLSPAGLAQLGPVGVAFLGSLLCVLRTRHALCWTPLLLPSGGASARRRGSLGGRLSAGPLPRPAAGAAGRPAEQVGEAFQAAAGCGHGCACR